MEAFYFGTTAKRLFGCYHEPQSEPRECGVLLCYPMGQEYIRSHRAYRQLAVRLSQAGFPVLRFDFFASGDSSGDDDEAEIAQWLVDISSAMAELRARSGRQRICLVGLRLGGTLAAMVGAEHGDVDAMILWDPVINGKTYVEELLMMHQAQMQKYSSENPGSERTEILGFRVTKTLLEELNRIDLAAMPQKPADAILLIESSDEAVTNNFKNKLENAGVRVTYEHVPSPKIWLRQEEYSLVVPAQSIQAMVSWMSDEVSG